MVKLTAKYLFRKISKKNQLHPRKKDETDLDYLRRMTHLHLQSQFIDKIASIPECLSVSVVYLQNNLLRTIQNMENFPNLTHLYLQHNFITKIENLNKLTSLRKLYLGYNEISVVEGLENLTSLTELHLENQRLPLGETLYFDPLSLSQLRHTLKILNVANNNMSSIRCLSELASLSKLIVDNNQLRDLDDIMETLSCLPVLETLSSDGNPVASDRKYLDAVVISSKSVKVLNGKPIDEKTRMFITNLARTKESQKKLSEFSTRAFNSSESFPRAVAKAHTLGEIASEMSAQMRSKLFPVLKVMADGRRKGTKNLSQVSKDSVVVSRFPGSASFLV